MLIYQFEQLYDYLFIYLFIYYFSIYSRYNITQLSKNNTWKPQRGVECIKTEMHLGCIHKKREILVASTRSVKSWLHPQEAWNLGCIHKKHEISLKTEMHLGCIQKKCEISHKLWCILVASTRSVKYLLNCDASWLHPQEAWNIP